jgi:hypothetical protein
VAEAVLTCRKLPYVSRRCESLGRDLHAGRRPPITQCVRRHRLKLIVILLLAGLATATVELMGDPLRALARESETTASRTEQSLGRASAGKLLQAQYPTAPKPQSGSRPIVDLRIIDMDAISVLKLVAADTNVAITADPGLKTRLTNLALTGAVPEVLDRLAAAANLAWWWDGNAYRVVDRRDYQTQTWTIGDEAVMAEILTNLSIPPGTVTYRRTGENGVYRVSAPRLLIDELQPLVKKITEHAKQIRVVRYGRTSTVKTN